MSAGKIVVLKGRRRALSDFVTALGFTFPAVYAMLEEIM